MARAREREEEEHTAGLLSRGRVFFFLSSPSLSKNAAAAAAAAWLLSRKKKNNGFNKRRLNNVHNTAFFALRHPPRPRETRFEIADAVETVTSRRDSSRIERFFCLFLSPLPSKRRQVVFFFFFLVDGGPKAKEKRKKTPECEASLGVSAALTHSTTPSEHLGCPFFTPTSLGGSFEGTDGAQFLQMKGKQNDVGKATLDAKESSEKERGGAFDIGRRSLFLFASLRAQDGEFCSLDRGCAIK